MRRLLDATHDALAEAWRELWRARLRALLAVAGVAVGAAALSFPLCIYHMEGRLMARARKKEWLPIAVPSIGIDPLRRRADLKRYRLTLDDAEAIRRECPSVERLVIFAYVHGGECKAGRRRCRASIASSDATRADDLRALEPTLGDSLEWGRVFAPAEIARGDRVLIVNRAMRRNLFGKAPLADAWVRVDGVRFKVIGALEARKFAYHPFPEALMPHTCAQDLYYTESWYFRGRPKPGAAEKAAREIDAVLFQRLGDPGESFISWGGPVGASEARIFAFFGLIGMLTLLSAGIAVSNKCYVDVLERVNEIALRRALGATAQRIYGTVVLESALLCGFGCAIGGGVGLTTFIILVGKAAPPGRVEVGLPLLPLGAMLLFTIVLGMIAALQAAAIAARADPAEALTRKEVV